MYSGSGAVIGDDDEDSVTVSLSPIEPPAEADNQPEQEEVTLKEPYEVDAPEEKSTGRASHTMLANTWLVALTVVVWATGAGLPTSLLTV